MTMKDNTSKWKETPNKTHAIGKKALAGILASLRGKPKKDKHETP